LFELTFIGKAKYNPGMSLLLFFIDGIGINHDSSAVNGINGLFDEAMHPAKLTGLEPGNPAYFDKGGASAVDAVLGIDGLPQSATGQASIFTGTNAQKFLGYHQTALPNKKLADLIGRKSLMKELGSHGISVTSANLYSQEFFDSRRGGKRNRFPVSTLTIAAADVPFRFYRDYLNGEAVFADITNTLIRNRGWDIDEISAEQAAGNMLNILGKNDFVFFEYFMTDVFGHRRDAESLRTEVAKLNSFVNYLLRDGNHSILIVSDHGNAENLESGDHTLNPVPAILLGEAEGKTHAFLEGLERIDQIYKRVIRVLFTEM
jgi:2,3-bisphosphoglycerate-independent phosphoglycerate mutase